jgi:hypothetical protein
VLGMRIICLASAAVCFDPVLFDQFKQAEHHPMLTVAEDTEECIDPLNMFKLKMTCKEPTKLKRMQIGRK